MKLIKEEIVGDTIIKYFINNEDIIIIRQRRRKNGWTSEGRQYIDTGTLRTIRKILVETGNIELLNKLRQALEEEDLQK